MDESIQAIEDQINSTVVPKISKLEQSFSSLQHVDLKLDKHITFIKDTIEKIN